MRIGLIDFLCRCSGIREDALRLAPSGRIIASTQGLLLLAVAAFSSIAAGYAVHRVFLGRFIAGPAAIGVGLLWGVFIFALDRSLALSFDPGAAKWARAGAAAVRVALAAVVASAISTPLILRVAEPVLDAALRQRHRDMVKQEAAQNADALGLSGYEEEVARLETEVGRQRDRLRNDPDTSAFRWALSARDQAEQRHVAVATANSQRIGVARRELAVLTAAAEITDAPEARQRALRASIRGWQGEINAAAAAQQRARDEVVRMRREWFDDEKERLDRLEEAIAPARSARQHAFEAVAGQQPEAEGRWTELLQPTLINHYTTFTRITADHTHPDRAALRQVAWMLHLLWFLVETSVLLMKVSWPRSELDAAIETLTRVNVQQIEDRAAAREAIDQEWLRARHTLERRATTLWSRENLRRLRSSNRDLRAHLGRIRDEFDVLVQDERGPVATARNALH